MARANKELMFQHVLAGLKDKTAIFFARFEGLSVKEFEELRRQLDRLSDRVFVAKNTIIRRALQEIGAQESLSWVEGQVLLISARSEPQDLSKALLEFSKGRAQFKLQGAFLEGRSVQLAFIQELAKLPPRTELLSAVLGRMMAPLSGLAVTLHGVIRSLAIALNEVAKKKEPKEVAAS